MGRNRWIQIALLMLGLLAVGSNAQAAQKYKITSLKEAINKGHVGPMASGLSVERTSKLDSMLLRSMVNLELASHGVKVPVTRMSTLNVRSIASTAVNLIKNGNPGKLLVGTLVAGAIAQLPGATYDAETGELVRSPEVVTSGFYWAARYNNNPPGYVPSRHSTALESCKSLFPTSSMSVNSSNNCVRYDPTSGQPYQVVGWTTQVAFNCPHGVNPETYACHDSPQQSVPFLDADWADLEDAIVTANPAPEDVRQGWYEICNGDGSCMSGYVEPSSVVNLPSVQGPATFPVSSTTTTTQGPEGTTTTKKDKFLDLDYSTPDEVVVREREEITTTKPDGSTSTETTVDNGEPIDAGSESPQEDFDGDFQDSPFPEVEPFYEQKYPDGLEGVWEGRQAEIDASAFISFLQSFIPNFSGSCPAYGLSFDLGFANYGSHGFDVGCYVFEFIGVIIMVTALFTARALIFGG